MRSLSIFALCLALTGCGFAQKHPGTTVGIVAGTIGFSACALNVDDLGTCALIGGGAGLALGGLTGLVTIFADTSASELTSGPPVAGEEEEPFVRRVRTKTAPPPVPVDAGVPMTPVDAGPPSDAGVPAPDAL